MKPDKVVCQQCGKQISKGKWCSDKCRMANKRTQKPEQNKTNKGEQNHTEHEQIVPEQVNPNKDEFRSSLTKTDKTFYDRAIKEFEEPYYYFNEMAVEERECRFCNTKFKTTLKLNYHCSYEHFKQSFKKKVLV